MKNIRLAEEKDLEQIKKLIDENISIDFYSFDYLREALNNPDKYIYVYTDEQDRPAALLYMFTAVYSEAKKILKISGELPGLKDDCPVIVYKTTCTDIHFRKNGILSRLMEAVERDFRDRGYHYIILEALKIPSGKIPAESGLNFHHFKAVKEIRHPWADKDSYCPYCRNRFCQCNAVLYMKELNNICQP